MNNFRAASVLCGILCLTFAGNVQAQKGKPDDNQQIVGHTQDERAINEILRLGGQYWNSPRGPYLPKNPTHARSTRVVPSDQQVVVSNTPLETAQPPLVRAYLPAATTDDSLRLFANLSQLEFIYLDRTRITDTGLSCLKNLPQLYNVSLRNTQVGDAGLTNLTVLSQLEILSLEGTKITDAGLKLLSKQPKIQRLFLDNTEITDAGLIYLADLPNLNMLTLDGTKVTEDGKQAFLNKKPDVNFRSQPRTPRSDPSGVSNLRPARGKIPTKTLPELLDPDKLKHTKLSVKRASNGETLPDDGGYKYVPDGRSHSMLLELKSLDLSEASELRFEVKKDEAYGSIKITLRDWGNLISDSIDSTAFIKGEHDGFQIVRIPIEAFKTNGWDMQSVKLLFIGDQTKREKGGPSFTVRSIEAGFKKQGD